MPQPDPTASDWTDLDLLTVAEAMERLDHEAEAVRREIELLTAGSDDASLAAARRRLELLDRARARAVRATVVVKPGRVRTRAEVEATPGPPD
jgi:hypothetical protein